MPETNLLRDYIPEITQAPTVASIVPSPEEIKNGVHSRLTELGITDPHALVARCMKRGWCGLKPVQAHVHSWFDAVIRSQ